MFGTHKVEDENEACIYGIRGTLNTFNPIWANLHVYMKIAKEMWLSKDWKEKFYAPFARTSWTPKSFPEKVEKDNFNSQTFEKFDPIISKQVKIYALFQYLFITYIFLAFIQSGYLNYFQLWITISMMAFTMFSTSMWLDGKEAMKVELLRLALYISIGIYAYLETSLVLIALSILIYAFINILLLPFIGKFQRMPRAQLNA